jgi:hypothetical protein
MTDHDPEAQGIGGGESGGFDDGFVTRVARVLRAPERLDPTFEGRVMAAVRAEAGVASRRVDSPPWWRRRRLVEITPLATLAMAAGVVALAVLGVVVGRATGRQPGAAWTPHQVAASGPATGADTVYIVRFVLVAPEAKSVSLVGDFNNWDRSVTPLTPGAVAGVWARAVALPPGTHQYAFIVDGTRWIADPAAPLTVQDDFGTASSIVTVGSHAG